MVILEGPAHFNISERIESQFLNLDGKFKKSCGLVTVVPQIDEFLETFNFRGGAQRDNLMFCRRNVEPIVVMVVLGEDAFLTISVRLNIDDFHTQDSPFTAVFSDLFLAVSLDEFFYEPSDFPGRAGIHIVAE